MARIRIYPHNMGSGGASRLRDELRNRGHNVFKVRRNGAYRPRRNDTILNWGNSEPFGHSFAGVNFLNLERQVTIAHDKLNTFQTLRAGNVSIPEFTTNRAEAVTWLRQGTAVFARTMLNASEGRGIVEMDRPEDIVNAPLYVKYIKKMREYRVHVFNGQVIDITEKRKRRDFEGERDTRVRNTANGYVFARENVQPDASVAPLAIAAVRALGLDFGGVDIIWNNHRRQAYVLEVNTAPGLEGTTIERYADAIENCIRSRPQRENGRNDLGQVPQPPRRNVASVRESRRPTRAPIRRRENDRNRDNTDF